MPWGRSALRRATVAEAADTLSPAGFHASKCSLVRSNPAADHIPDSNSGRGRCTGLGRTTDGAMVKNGPSCCTGSGPQQASNACTKSPIRAPRVVMSVPDASCSSSFHPTPNPTTSRPSDSRSMVDNRWASDTGQ